MLTKLRARLARLIAPAAPAVPTFTADQERAGLRRGISLKALTQVTAATAAIPNTFARYSLPDLPPGVVPVAFDAKLATDEFPRSAMAFDDGFGPALGWLNGFNALGCGLYFPGYPYLAELTQISEYRAPSETISTEMTRKWLEVVGKGKDDKSEKIKAITERLDALKVRDHFRRAALLDGEFGRAQIIFNFRDQDDEKRQLPLDISPAGVKKGSLLSIQTIEPYWSTPYSWNAQFPERQDFYKPTSWFIMGRKVHASRMLTFIGREVPDLLKPAYNFGGISLTQLMQPYVNAWLRTRKSVSDITHNFSIVNLSTDLSTTLQDGGDATGLLARAKLFTTTRDNQGLMLTDKEAEELKVVEASLASLDKLQAQAQEQMSAPAHIPLIKMFGVTPTGLNATGEGEIKVWYDFVAAQQENLFGPHFETLLRVVQLDMFGAIDDDITFKWVAMDEPTVKELSEIRKSDVDGAVALIGAGVISPEEAREKIQGDPDSGYDNLDGPAPEPQPDPNLEMQLEHESSMADKSGGDDPKVDG
jgi:phage-related protein (TIGR01555 family)